MLNQKRNTTQRAKNIGGLGQRILQPRASAASSNKAHNAPQPRRPAEKYYRTPTKRDEKRMGFIKGKIRAKKENSGSKQPGPTPTSQAASATKIPPQRDGLGTQQTSNERSRIATPRIDTPTQALKSLPVFSKLPPPRDRRSWTLANGIGSGHAWGVGGGSKSAGLRYSQPQPMDKSDMEHDRHVGEAYGTVEYIYGKR